jgi:hypothetical protein
MSVTVLASMIGSFRNRRPVFYPDRSAELDRADSQLG